MTGYSGTGIHFGNIIVGRTGYIDSHIRGTSNRCSSATDISFSITNSVGTCWSSTVRGLTDCNSTNGGDLNAV